MFNQYPPRRSKNGGYEFYRLMSVGDPKIDLTQPEFSDHILRIKSPWLIRNQDKELTVDASNDWVFIDNEDRFHSFFMVSSSDIKPKDSFEVQMFLGLLDYVIIMPLHMVCIRLQPIQRNRPAICAKHSIKIERRSWTLDVSITEYYSTVRYIFPMACFDSKINTMVNDSFKQFAKCGQWSDFSEDFEDSLEEVVKETVESNKDHQAHDAKDLEKLIIPLLNKTRNPISIKL